MSVVICEKCMGGKENAIKEVLQFNHPHAKSATPISDTCNKPNCTKPIYSSTSDYCGLHIVVMRHGM